MANVFFHLIETDPFYGNLSIWYHLLRHDLIRDKHCLSHKQSDSGVGLCRSSCRGSKVQLPRPIYFLD